MLFEVHFNVITPFTSSHCTLFYRIVDNPFSHSFSLTVYHSSSHSHLLIHLVSIDVHPGELNARRTQMVLMAFQLLDTDESGVIEISDLLGMFDGSKHPDVISGKRAFEDVLREFLDTFDAGG